MTAAPVRAVFLGSGGFGQDALQRLAARDDVRLVGVVTAPPRPVGRRQAITATVIGAAAADLGIERILSPERLRAPEAVAEVLALDPDLLVLADYGQIVPVALLASRHGALNLHPSLLPTASRRDADPGDDPGGRRRDRASRSCGWTKVSIPARSSRRRPVALDGTETAPDLEAVLATLGADLLDRSLGPWLRGELAARPQAEAGATLTRPLRREDGRLDPATPAVELERQVRAYQPWPGSYLETPAGRVIVLSAGVDADSTGDPGRLTERGIGNDDGDLDPRPGPAGRRPPDAVGGLPPGPPGPHRVAGRVGRMSRLR